VASRAFTVVAEYGAIALRALAPWTIRLRFADGSISAQWASRMSLQSVHGDELRMSAFVLIDFDIFDQSAFQPAPITSVARRVSESRRHQSSRILQP
jgi:hypothetical protein